MHVYPLVLEEHVSVRYCPAAHFRLEQALHCVLDVPPHLPETTYWSVLQDPVHAVQVKPLVVPLHFPNRYWPCGQFKLEHVLHSALDVFPHGVEMYESVPQDVVHALHL